MENVAVNVISLYLVKHENFVQSTYSTQYKHSIEIGLF